MHMGSIDQDLSVHPAPAETGPHDEDMVRSVASRTRVRQQLSQDIEAFLRNGGAIRTVDSDVRADPPRKPDVNYGALPI